VIAAGTSAPLDTCALRGVGGRDALRWPLPEIREGKGGALGAVVQNHRRQRRHHRDSPQSILELIFLSLKSKLKKMSFQTQKMTFSNSKKMISKNDFKLKKNDFRNSKK
jgi:hypothetical protein